MDSSNLAGMRGTPKAGVIVLPLPSNHPNPARPAFLDQNQKARPKPPTYPQYALPPAQTYAFPWTVGHSDHLAMALPGPLPPARPRVSRAVPKEHPQADRFQKKTATTFILPKSYVSKGVDEEAEDSLRSNPAGFGDYQAGYGYQFHQQNPYAAFGRAPQSGEGEEANGGPTYQLLPYGYPAGPVNYQNPAA